MGATTKFFRGPEHFGDSFGTFSEDRYDFAWGFFSCSFNMERTITQKDGDSIDKESREVEIRQRRGEPILRSNPTSGATHRSPEA